jgi:hypothetical protein
VDGDAVPARPLDPQAVSAADDALYDAHESDPRPNSLFDTAGNRLPLNDRDPTQECLREQWINLYRENGGKVTVRKRKNSSQPGAAVLSCPVPKAKLSVYVHYEPLDAPVENATVTIKGPVTKSSDTDDTGMARFDDLPPGSYEITAVYTARNPLVDFALSQDGSVDWAGNKDRQAPGVQAFRSGTNKCNLFIYEMLTGAGYTVPTKPHAQKLLGITVRTVQIPPNAGDWASSAGLTGIATHVSWPLPGDVVAWSHDYTDATGHVGIVSYPKPSTPTTKNLAAGDDATADVTMRRKTISAHWDKVGDDDYYFWHYFDEGNTAEVAKMVFSRLNQ